MTAALASMDAGVLSLLALLVVIGASLTSRVNVGILSVALAWPIAMYVAGWKLDAFMRAFPSSLFLTLLGVSLLFGIAGSNGTMAAVTARAVRVCRGRAGALPFLFFALACVMSTAGPGAIATTALLVPLAMGMATRVGVPVLLTALMVGNGANAGNLSPVSAIGVLVLGFMERAGLGGHELAVWSANFTAHLLAALAAWLLFGGVALLRSREAVCNDVAVPFTRTHHATLVVLAIWIAAVVFGKANPGLAAFVASAGLIAFRAAEEPETFRQVPWAVLTMVCGVSVLIAVLEGTGGMERFTSMLAQVATPRTVNGTIAFVTGLISTYSSTSGVVYPAFLPAAPGLVAKLGGGDPLAVALSVNVGAALVDVSPLSTIGALCIAAAPPGTDTRRLFRALLLWGFAMTVAGAVFCQLFIGFFA